MMRVSKGGLQFFNWQIAQSCEPPFDAQIIYSKKEIDVIINLFLVERVMGIEPTYLAWKASVLPLNYTRM